MIDNFMFLMFILYTAVRFEFVCYNNALIIYKFAHNGFKSIWH